MKQVLLITLFALCSSAFAQDKKLSFGIQAGYASSTTSEKAISNNDVISLYSPVGSITAGAYVNYQITSSFSLQPEIIYFQKGFICDTEFRSPSNTQDSHQEYRINCIGIPILGKLGFGKAKTIFALIGASPQLSVSSKYSFIHEVVTPVPYSSSGEVSNIPHLKSFDTPIVVGVGFERPIGKIFANINLRYNFGLLDAWDDSRQSKDSRLSSFMILAGIRF